MAELFETLENSVTITREKAKKSRRNRKSTKGKKSKANDKIDGQISMMDKISNIDVSSSESSNESDLKLNHSHDIEVTDKVTQDASVITNETELKPNEVIDIPRDNPGSILKVAIKNSGKYFAEKNRELKHAEEHPYVAKESIMTKAETKLYMVMDSTFNSKLKCIGKSVRIFPKLRLADVVEVADALKYRKEYLYKIAYKHVDYVICDSQTFDVVCVVELDDFYHTRKDKIERDKFVNETLRNCGIQLFRVDEPIKNVNPDSLNFILDYLLEYYAPICPSCGKLMVANKSRRNKNYGHRFYGCSGWRPGGEGCQYTIDID